MRFFRGFGRQQAPPSSAVAKQRLKVVLVSDQMRMSPGLLAAIRADLVDVLSRPFAQCLYVSEELAHVYVLPVP